MTTTPGRSKSPIMWRSDVEATQSRETPGPTKDGRIGQPLGIDHRFLRREDASRSQTRAIPDPPRPVSQWICSPSISWSEGESALCARARAAAQVSRRCLRAQLVLSPMCRRRRTPRAAKRLVTPEGEARHRRAGG
jgi:hypothetical protein